MKILRVTCCLFVLLLSLVAFSFVAVHPAAAQTLNPPPPPEYSCRAGANVTITPTGNTLTIAATGGSGSSLAVKEEDGSPMVANVTELRVSNGTLTNNGGGSVSITTGGGTGSCGSLCTADIFDATTQYNIGGNRMLSAPGGRNLFIGHLAGGIPADLSATNNTFVGPSAGSSNETGSGNTYIGTYAGSSSKNGVQNVYIGYTAGGGFTNGGGIANVFVGTGAGQRTNLGGSNTFLGSGAGGTQITGNSNTALGAGATPGTSNLSFATAVGRRSSEAPVSSRRNSKANKQHRPPKRSVGRRLMMPFEALVKLIAELMRNVLFSRIRLAMPDVTTRIS